MDLEFEVLSFQGLKKRNNGEVQFQLKVQPSFYPEFRWILIKDGPEYFVRRFSQAKIGEPLPFGNRWVGSEALLDSSIVKQIKNKIKNIEIRAFNIEESFGIDGTNFEIQLDRFAGTTTIRWWSGCQSGWGKLKEWFNETVSFFQTVLPGGNIGCEYEA